MANALHHYLDRRGKNFLDKLIYISAFVGPVLTIPQVLKIFGEKNASGVSIIYWLGILGGAILWGSYGLVHKEKPIIIANLLAAILAVLIVIGIIFYGSSN